MGRKLFTLLVAGICSLVFVFSYAEDEMERKLVLRQAQKQGNTSVAVEAYLIGDILETTVYVRMYSSKPKIFNILLVGPKLGRLSPRSKTTLYPKVEEQEADLTFPTTDIRGGHIRFSKRTEEKVSQGRLTRELAKFKIPRKRILAKRRYELRILVESMQRSGQTEYFRFPLKDFAQLFLEQ